MIRARRGRATPENLMRPLQSRVPKAQSRELSPCIIVGASRVQQQHHQCALHQVTHKGAPRVCTTLTDRNCSDLHTAAALPPLPAIYWAQIGRQRGVNHYHYHGCRGSPSAMHTSTSVATGGAVAGALGAVTEPGALALALAGPDSLVTNRAQKKALMPPMCPWLLTCATPHAPSRHAGMSAHARAPRCTRQRNGHSPRGE